MDGINAKANTNITLAHDFNDEVEYHQNLNKQKPNQAENERIKNQILNNEIEFEFIIENIVYNIYCVLTTV
jgi:hypothetical protein